MRYFYAALAVVLILLVILILVLLIKRRMRRAREKVCSLCMEEKICSLNAALEPFGFCYDETDDSISSRMYPWQREMGYCRAYDEAAVMMNMVFDCEPIYFDYGERRYLIEVWKGQYGCATGAEIGVYVSNTNVYHTNVYHTLDFAKPAEDLFYECVGDEMRLNMCFNLYKNGEIILRRSGLHWWLTGFRAGMFSQPKELKMEVSISFPNAGMCSAFYEGLLRTGYDRTQVCTDGYTVSFCFGAPCTEQPRRHCRLFYRWIMWRNRCNCRRYCRITKCFCSTLDRISYLGYCFPALYRMLIRIGMKCNLCRYQKCRDKHSRCRRCNTRSR